MSTCAIPTCSRPRYNKSGVVHGFCGRSHAQEAVSTGLLASLRPPNNLCCLPNCSKPVYCESTTGRVHDFCCRVHARRWTARGNRQPSSKGAFMCRSQGCKEAVYRDPVTGKDTEYCGKTHATLSRARECVRSGCSNTAWLANTKGKQFCGANCATLGGFRSAPRTVVCCGVAGCREVTLRCRQAKQDLGYCSEKHRLAAVQTSNGLWQARSAEPYVDGVLLAGSSPSTGFKLSALSEAHPEFPSLHHQFTTKWVKPLPAGGLSVRRIFRIEMPAAVRHKHEEYTRTMHNVRRRFHGTPCSDGCKFLVDTKKGPCGQPACNVCSICTHGFKLTKDVVGQTARSSGVKLRFGNGLYFTSTSGKANDYARLTEQTAADGATLRCMFVVNVAASKAYLTKKTQLTNNECPPQGYNSVVGEAGCGLNYDEVVVYKEEAALPKYLIVYALG